MTMKNRTKQDIYTLYLRKRRKGVLRMFTIFKEEKVITAGILVFLCLSVLVRLMLAWMYHTMIRETDNMATTGNRLLKQCKVKFANCYQLNGGVSNIPVFVDKFLNRLSFGHLSFDAWYHLSGQCMLFSVIFAGVGICKGILDGRMLGEILPFYIASFLGLYLYFSLSALVDIKGKRRVLKTNLIDYLENHLSGRIPVTEQDYERLYGASKLPGRRTVELMPIRGRTAQPQEMVRETGREVFSTEHEMPGKMEDRGMAQQDETSRVTEEELQALLQELLTV
jgi:hypothetical protein